MLVHQLDTFQGKLSSLISQQRAVGQEQIFGWVESIKIQQGQHQQQTEKRFVGLRQSLRRMGERTNVQGQTQEERQRLIREKMHRWQLLDLNRKSPQPTPTPLFDTRFNPQNIMNTPAMDMGNVGMGRCIGSQNASGGLRSTFFAPETNQGFLNSPHVGTAANVFRPTGAGVNAGMSSIPLGSIGRPDVNQLRKIEAPPKFEPRNLSLWKRNLQFWKDIYLGIPEEQLLAAIGLKGEPELKDLLYGYYREFSDRDTLRSLEGFYLVVEREYG